ncbi:MAG: hypothetical protein OSJ36_05140 [Odoribacter sp.]|nr:hypothetical protein [Odoribacter sp.]
MKTESVTVNSVMIDCPIENGVYYVAIRPICDALGIDYRKQFERIKSDQKLGQLVTHTVTNSNKDGKNYEMFCLPLKYIFGWLFSIDESKVNPRSKEIFIRYKDECYDVLYDHFVQRAQKQIQTNATEIKMLEQLNELMVRKNELSGQIREVKNNIERIRAERLDQQLTLF